MKHVTFSVIATALTFSIRPIAAQTNTFPSNGSVGIGTLSPNHLLHVAGNASTNAMMIETPNQGPWALRIRNLTAPNRGLEMFQDDSGTSQIWNNYGSATPALIALSIGGNVGIGTSGPIAKLHVSTSSSGLPPMLYSGGGLPQWPATLQNISGSNSSNASAAVIGLNLENSSSSANSFAPFISFSRKSDSGYYNPAIAAIGGLYTGQGPDSNWGAGALTFWTAGNGVYGPLERMRIDQSGNIGVRTTSPSAPLQIGESDSDPLELRAFGYITTRSGAVGGSRIIFQSTRPNGRQYEWYNDIEGDGTFGIYDRTATNTRFLLTATGNVGIGTTNPTQKLSVNGTIRAKEVIVEASPWPDDVFDEGYELKALSETEAYIKAEKHLPGIPSEQQVAESGVALGDMQTALLRKVEEMTLHMIRQEKRQDELQREVGRLRDENAELRDEVSILKNASDGRDSTQP